MSACSNSLNSKRTESSASNAAPLSPKLCRHEMQANLFTSMTDTNPCRRFYRCPNQKVSDCKFFEWVDDELPPFQKGCVQRLKFQRDSLNEQLKCKIVAEGLLQEGLRLKNSEVEALKSCNEESNQLTEELLMKNIKLESRIEELIVQNHNLRKKKIMLHLVIVVLVFIFVYAKYDP